MYGATDFRRQEFSWVRLEEDFKVRRYQLAYEYIQFIKMINSSAAVRGYFSFAWAPSEKIIMNLFEIFSIDFKIFFSYQWTSGLLHPLKSQWERGNSTRLFICAEILWDFPFTSAHSTFLILRDTEWVFQTENQIYKMLEWKSILLHNLLLER